ncbi:WXG100 family type VII secretion target [Nocardioides panaciterrulae]|uniref:WXG100 family type VII secretion target n=1 Tax=Nocardioides panaciterrulae TaxID=661492 RepID=A0A7Y9E8F3_9ACTN|nr:WXG100 family type VII secretion target [Nocardioides panaciterrulae]
MDDLALEHATLDRAVSAVSTVFDELTVAGRRLDARARGFLGTGWQGEAAAAFADGYEEWAAGAQEVLGSVASMAALIAQANQRFADSDAAVGGSMQAIASRLGGRG